MLALLFAAALSAVAAAPAGSSGVVDAYIEKYFETFPSRATEAGRHDRDSELEDLTPERRAAWIAFNRKTLDDLSKLPAAASEDDRRDAELLRARVEWELFELADRRRADARPALLDEPRGQRDGLPARPRRPAARRAARGRAGARRAAAALLPAGAGGDGVGAGFGGRARLRAHRIRAGEGVGAVLPRRIRDALLRRREG